MVELAHRGIISSICSKSDPEKVKTELAKLGVWDYFVFPAIAFTPKGKAIAELIGDAGLRSENVLFIDDNPGNLEEAKFFNPGITTAYPTEVLDGLLENPRCKGKPDPNLTRLKQYQFLQRKSADRQKSDLSNEDFLRASNIKVVIEYDLEKAFDRVLELVNRANQLNYTKKRIETPEAIADFKERLTQFGYHAGCVFASDSYGDYGLIGFFLQRRIARNTRLEHFVFSCRTMNMGIEQYVYEKLGKPGLRIAEPVSYGLETHNLVDWINTGGDASELSSTPKADKLVLLGGCDLLQIASYCGSDRLEFVNFVREGMKIRYDNPAFVLADREALKNCEPLRKIPWWTYADALRFDEGVANADMILLQIWNGMSGPYFQVAGGVRVRIQKSRRISKKNQDWFNSNFVHEDLKDKEKLDMTSRAFDRIGMMSKHDCRISVIGIYTGGGGAKRRAKRDEYNRWCQQYCEMHSEKFRFVPMNNIILPEDRRGLGHFNRAAYFRLAQAVLDVAGKRPTDPIL